ncbi:MAG: hypothetical protein ACLR0U_06735 [Enterocloster clostridioformis]
MRRTGIRKSISFVQSLLSPHPEKRSIGSRNYIFDTLHAIKKYAEVPNRRWCEMGRSGLRKNWIDWQEHMEKLVGRLDIILDSPEAEIELIPLQRPEHQEMENSREGGAAFTESTWTVRHS